MTELSVALVAAGLALGAGVLLLGYRLQERGQRRRFRTLPLGGCPHCGEALQDPETPPGYDEPVCGRCADGIESRQRLQHRDRWRARVQ
jgi:hypothetical protein